MESSFIYILSAFITAASLAYVSIKKSNSETKASTIAGEFAISDRLEAYINKLEERITKMETEIEAVRMENRRLTLDNEAKTSRIGILETQVIDLQKQLDNYKHIDTAKVDDAKATLHQQVEENLEDIKK